MTRLTIQRFTCSTIVCGALAMAAVSTFAFDGATTSPEKEHEFLAVLRSDAQGAEKAMACKNLAIYGSSDAVPDLAKLLPDPQLSSWARIALEAIPGDASDAALRKAVDTLEGQLLVGTINSIGVRRDALAVEALTGKLQHADHEVASAAAVALGQIANDAAVKSLRAVLTGSNATVRSAVAEGCVLCAERLASDGHAKVATEIYDEVRKSDVPLQRIIEATRGSILARGQDGIPLLMETFQSDERKLIQLALGTVREFPGNEIDKVLATELSQTTPERAALLIQAMADRPETVVLSAILHAAEEGDKQVRLSAVEALRRVGDDSCLATLLKIASGDDSDLAEKARTTLARLPGQRVDASIVAMLPKADESNHALLLQLVGERRIDAVPEVMKALDSSAASVRTAALVALGETVSLDKLPVLISQMVAPKHAEDAAVAQQAPRRPA
ncbi:MAG: hypothetical protein R3C59_03875 [Planctomycetaceae bacterium]